MIKRLLLFFLIVAFAPTYVFAQDLNSIDQQINQFNDQLNKAQAQSQTLQGQIGSFDQNIGNLQGEINQTGVEIDTKEKDIIALSEAIEIKKQELEKQKIVLAESLRFLYETGDTPVLELILGSKSISSALDQMEYISWVEKQIEDTINKIDQAKKAIEADKQKQEDEKAALIDLQTSQNAQLSALGEQRSAKSELLAYTQNNEQVYQQKISDLYALREYLSSLYQESVATGGTGGYPWGNGCSDGIDSWGYYIGQCTSYVAWKRSTIGKPINRAIGNGGEWTGAAAGGYPDTSTPEGYGDAMVFPSAGGYGHVAFVESVNSNGTVNISEFNYNGDCSYHTRNNVNPWNYPGVHFIH